eukprot:gnl/TRDRNA2_/TRDRNA2_68382_c0_seq1.p1 gnl/TRDRNA2_/TRDRNA2_68382_c0~~gnl/TRDRNA2_/TRDRNA2_68382_c0_seq1.p1  ORF type:complete len:244 (+),score=50.60 gnl/TRDRNA2_/TRDRNA2_68382_c0_seq1:52-783(+)
MPAVPAAMAALTTVVCVGTAGVRRCPLRHGIRGLLSGLGGSDLQAGLRRKQAEDQRSEKADAYLSSRGRPKVVVGGSNHIKAPPLARGSGVETDARAAVGGTQAEREMQRWIQQGGDQGLKGSGAPLPERKEDHMSFSSDAGSQALTRAMKDAGFKPASIEAAEEVKKAEERVVGALRHALRKGNSTQMELEEAARVPREACAERMRAYNSAVLADRETFGGSWPLQQRSQRSFEEDVMLARK